MALTQTDRAQHMAQQIIGFARLHNHGVVTNVLVEELMSRDADTEQGKAHPVTVRRIIRQQAVRESVRVIFTRDERYWAIREQLHRKSPAEIDALADSIAGGGDRDPRGWDRELVDAISAYRSNRPTPARLYGCKPVAIRLWRTPAPAIVDKAQAIRAAVDASGLSLGDPVQFPGRVVETDEGREFVPGAYGHLRDVWASDGQIVASVEGPEGERATPLLSDLRPLRWHMRTMNGGTPERIPTLDALREINNAMTDEGRKGVQEMSASGSEARIVYRGARGEVWLRPATAAEIAMEQKPEGERYAEGDRVIVRGTFYRPQEGRTYVLDEYVGTVVNWTGFCFNVRAVEPDEDGTTYGVRPRRVRELRPVPPTVDDVADAPHDLYLNGELRHQGVTAERVRKIVRNLRGKRAVFYQDPADRAIVSQNARYVPQRPTGDPEPATGPAPQVWSEEDRKRARGFAAKWRSETVCAEPPVEAEPTDEALARCFEHTVRPIRAELYPLVRAELAGWDARIAAEDAARPENIPAVSPAPLFTALAAYEAANDIGMAQAPEDMERLARHLLSMGPGAPSPERRALVTAHYALEGAAESLRAAAERRGKPGQLPVVNAARDQADEAIGAAREAILGVQPHAARIRPTDVPASVDTIRAAARAYLSVTGTPEELAAIETGTPTVQVWCSSDKQSGWTVTAHLTAGVSAELDGTPVHIPAHPPILRTFRKRDGRVGADENARKHLGSRLRFNVPVEYVEDSRV
ncbi:hypothetical protein [Streptomyces cyaneofuscatus]|uniref:hypothetical protein n=1 Tax=Streptomyces cyaneofuscatus TaxID=66883 RepID=UPI0038036043